MLALPINDLYEPMCSFVSALCDRAHAEETPAESSTRRGQSVTPTGETNASPNPELTATLLAFFRKRLRVASDHDPRSGLAHVLARRTLTRLARQRASAEKETDETTSKRRPPPKSEVLRAALMELRKLEASAPPADTAPPVFRN